MADVVSPEKRSEMMAGIKGKDTKPEMIVRRGLHSMGFRYRLHDPSLPGKPDLVFKKYNAVILVHGCFWHGHDCHLFKWPKSNASFWKEKIGANVRRDHVKVRQLKANGWRVCLVWECALRGKYRKSPIMLLQVLAEWLQSSSTEDLFDGRIS